MEINFILALKMYNPTKPSSMFAKSYCLIILFLLTFSLSYAQEKDYVQFDVSPYQGAQIKEVSKGKLTQVYTSVAFVNVQLTALFKTSPLYHRAYFNVKDTAQLRLSTLDAPIYLAPHQEFLIDILDPKNDSLIKRYVLQRPRMIPVIQFYAEKKITQPFYSSPVNGKIGEVEFPPNAAVKLSIDERDDFKNLMTEYSLLNLKTRQQQHGVGLRSLSGLKFASNTDYELRVNYVLQKESTGVVYIHVKPYWYQSSLTYIILLTVLVIMAFVLLFLFLKKRIRYSQKQQQKLEQAALRLQSLLNPHFTFNALSSIQGLMNTDRIDEANQYLEEFSSLLRKTLTKSQQVFNNLEQELEMMRLYLKLEAFRFNFAWQIEVETNIQPSLIEIPTLLLQPLIENAIKHGLGPLGDQGALSIICKSSEKKDTFVIIVKDNGQWLDQNTPSGYGLALTQERIATINQMKKDQRITLHFDKQQGTQAVFTFHHWI